MSSQCTAQRKQWRGFAIVRILLGLLLLTAAGFKGYEQFIYAQALGQSFWEARWIRLFLIELEACLGLWLLTGFLPWVARRVTLVAFSVFACTNVWQIWRGEPSCDCFGFVHIDPRIVLTFDGICIGVLAICKPVAPAFTAEGAPEHRARARTIDIIFASCGLTLFGGGLAVYTWYRPPDELFRLFSVDPPQKDFGPVRQNESLAHDFVVRNEWTQPIEVAGVLSSCSCTAADDFVGTVLAPGQTAPLHVTFNPGQREGQRSGTITLYYRAHGMMVPAWKTLTVQANVGTDYCVKPTVVDFGMVSPGRREIRTIRLWPNIQRVVQITRVESDSPLFIARQVPAPPGDSALHVEIECHHQAAGHSGPVSTVVHVHTDSVRAPITDIVVRALVVATVELEPESIVIGADVSGSLRREAVLRTKSPARITAVRAKGVQCEYDTAASTTHRIAMTVPDSTAPELARVEIDIELTPETGEREARTVTIPVHRLPRQKG
jgi:hypothetical protein